ncbi:unnamed protein product [Parnassius mnemosyne]
MTEDCFVKALKHFVMHIRPSKANPALVLMDNHSSHVNLRVVEFARQNSIIIVTFPPHCSHKLQPLDVTVYGPFKTRYRIAMNEWMLSNPGKTVTIYQVGQFVKEAYLAGFTPHNITQGFLKTGIYPLNSNIFNEEEFLSSYVTDRPDPSQSNGGNELNLDKKNIESNLRSTPPPSTNTLDAREENEVVTDQIIRPSPYLISNPMVAIPSTSRQQIISPEMIRPFSKAGPRQNTTRNNRRMSSAIVTDTPEKKILEEKECKICSDWAHESCGIKGKFNFFCKTCF